MKKILFLAIAMTTLMWACDSGTNSHSGTEAEHAHGDHAHGEHANEATSEAPEKTDHSDSHSEEISLNNGAKWKINEEMIPHITDAEKVFTEYHLNGGTDYTTLAASLNDGNNQLIKSCTMQGESHDQLHKWLHPHMELVDALAHADSPEKAAPIVESLEKSFATFNTFFE